MKRATRRAALCHRLCHLCHLSAASPTFAPSSRVRILRDERKTLTASVLELALSEDRHPIWATLRRGVVMEAVSYTHLTLPTA